ncbi:MAG: hypothetical protein ACI395_00480, partial [Candidatus Cryptobacteroides sp.]
MTFSPPDTLHRTSPRSRWKRERLRLKSISPLMQRIIVDIDSFQHRGNRRAAQCSILGFRAEEGRLISDVNMENGSNPKRSLPFVLFEAGVLEEVFYFLRRQAGVFGHGIF